MDFFFRIVGEEREWREGWKPRAWYISKNKTATRERALSSQVIRHNAKKIKRENVNGVGDRPHNEIAFKVYNIELMRITTGEGKTNPVGVAITI